MIASTAFPATQRRPAALAVTVALHVVLAALFLLRQPERDAEPAASWIDMIRIAPRPAAVAPAPPPQVRKPQLRGPAQARHIPAAPSVEPPDLAQPAASELVFPQAQATPPGPGAFELARAAAGGADKAMRKQFPERPLLRHVPLTEQQKLAEGINRAIRAPKFYEPARITKVQDQGVGYGRRIEKVQTAFGTYCITYEGNHGGDGRDPFKDALQPKLRNCPREK